MYHVKETTKPVPGNLDLNIADEDEFSPDKLRSVIESLYLTVVSIWSNCMPYERRETNGIHRF